jgi:Lon protease-like protein
VTSLSLPLFPLRTVLFPGGPLALRIFEPRYLDMISRCMKDDSSFGVVLIAEGREALGQEAHGQAQTEIQTQATGTLAKIVDWDQGEDGLLGLTAMGGDRFRLLSAHQQDDGLNVGSVEILPPEPEVPLPGDYALMADLLRAVMNDIGDLYAGVERCYDDASWVGYRFAEILSLDLESKQHCLEIDDPLVRLEFLRPFLRQIRDEQVG